MCSVFRYYRRVLREKIYLGGKSRKCARYYKRVLREKLTFETLISRSTLIIGQNTNFLTKKSNGQNTNFLPKQSKTCSILQARLREKLTGTLIIKRNIDYRAKLRQGAGGRKRIRYYKRVLRGNQSKTCSVGIISAF